MSENSTNRFSADTKRGGDMTMLWLACLGNLTMGAGATGLGSAWPAIRGDFARSLTDIQLPLLLFALGTVVPTLFAGRLIGRLGVGLLVFVCTVMQVASQFGAGLTHTWIVFGAMFLLLGIGTGIMDTAIKVVVTRRYTSKHLNWVHAGWSVGAWLGAGLISLMMTLGYSWRVGFGAVGVVLLVPVFVFYIKIKLWDEKKDTIKPALKAETCLGTGVDMKVGSKSLIESLKRLPVAGYVVNLILLYAVTYNIGMLASSVMVQVHGWDDASAARLVVWYWGALVPGRLILGSFADRMSNLRMIVLGCCGVMAGSAAVWFGGDWLPWMNTAGVLFIGFSTGPIISALTFGAARRVSAGHLVNINALQVIVANSCWVGMPVVTAWVLGDSHLTLLWPVAGISAALMMVLCVLGKRRSPHMDVDELK